MTERIADLGEWAEDSFSRLCARAGVTRNKASQDRTGWDYLVEFGSVPVPGLPIDLQPVGASARVQVKSKEKGPPFVVLKLSNALRFAQEPTPCFVILFQATDGAEPVRIYARHIWAEDMAKVLERARRAHAEGREDHHKISVRLTFTAADEHTDDLLPWMASIVGDRLDYAAEKLALLRSLGFEEDRIHGNISFKWDDLEALVDHQIGLTPTAPPMAIEILERRFGIDARVPIFAGQPDFVHLKPHPIPCRVRVRPPEGADIWLDGELLIPSFGELPIELAKLRVVADFLDIVITGMSGGTVTLRMDGARRRGLASHRAQIEVRRLAAAGPLQLQIMSEDRPNLPIEVTLAHREDLGLLEQYSNAIACLEKASAGMVPSDLALSEDDIDLAWNDIVTFNGLVNGTDFTGRFALEEPPPHGLRPPTCIFFYGAVQVGEWTFGAVVRRDVLAFALTSTEGTLALGPARVMESLVRRGPVASVLAELQPLYRTAVRLEKGSALDMLGGDYQTLLEWDRRSRSP